jgi:hypothetical protein
MNDKQTYRVRIDKDNFEVHVSSMKGRELLELAGKVPAERFSIFEKKQGQTIPVGLDQSVDLADPGRERFVTLPLDQTEGGRA